MSDRDLERLVAAVMLVGHTGAQDFEFGYLHDDVPTEKADWWAKAQYRGSRIMVEHHTSPIEAAEALADRRRLTREYEASRPKAAGRG